MIETLYNQAIVYVFHAILVAMGGVVAMIWRRTMAMQAGLQMLLMDRLIQEHDHYIQVGSIPLHKKIQYQKKHDAYLGLGANGILDQTYEEVMALPTKEGV